MTHNDNKTTQGGKQMRPTRKNIQMFRHTEKECWDAYTEKMETGKYESVKEPMFVGFNGGKFDKSHYYAEVKWK